MGCTNQIASLKSRDEIIDITFNLTNKCNFECYYCVAGERNDTTFEWNENAKEKLGYFIEKLKDIAPGIKINFLLTGGEPLLNPDFIQIASFLLGYEYVSVTITTNGILLGRIKGYGKMFSHKNCNFYITYHFLEYKKYDGNLEFIKKNLALLQKESISFKLNFLLPTRKQDFDDFLEIKKRIEEECFMSNKDYIINLIRENGVISTGYHSEILKYYDKYMNDEDDHICHIDIKTKDKHNISLSSTKEILGKGWNNFKGYRCYPFSVPTNILLNYDLTITFAGCQTLGRKVHTMDSVLEFLSKSREKYIICQDAYCTCSGNLGIKKEFDPEISKKSQKLDSLINTQVKSFLGDDKLKFISLDLLHDAPKGMKVSFLYNGNIYIYITIEEREGNTQYIKTIGNFGIHYYKTNYQGGIIPSHIDGIDNEINELLQKVIKVFALFHSIL